MSYRKPRETQTVLGRSAVRRVRVCHALSHGCPMSAGGIGDQPEQIADVSVARERIEERELQRHVAVQPCTANDRAA